MIEEGALAPGSKTPIRVSRISPEILIYLMDQDLRSSVVVGPRLSDLAMSGCQTTAAIYAARGDLIPRAIGRGVMTTARLAEAGRAVG